MTAFAFYIAKVALCSGVLTGYYWLLLRNKTFHRWNRFYLLFCVALSLAAPLLNINIGTANTTASYNVFRILNTVTIDEEVLVESNRGGLFSLTADQVLALLYVLISAFLFFAAAASAARIFKLLRSYPKTKIGTVTFLNTHAAGTPFSFFNYIVWNQDIDPASENGRQIFQHELAHVQQRHTWDKLFLMLILIPFWCNPFFWIIRRELHALHEFAADQKALESQDASELAQLILNTAFPKQHFLFTNPFFQSTIKRRIAMFTKLHNPKAAYISRILALPILLIVAAAFTLKAKAPHLKNLALDKQHAHLKKTGSGLYKDTFPRIGEVVKAGFMKDGSAVILFETGDFAVMKWKDAIANGYITKEEAEKQIEEIKANRQPVIVIDGKEDLNETVSSLAVFYDLMDLNQEVTKLSPENAMKKYGAKGRYGAIEIKSAETTSATDTIPKAMYKNKELGSIVYIKDEKDEVEISYKDGNKERITAKEAAKENLLNADTSTLTVFTPPVIKKELGSLELKDSITVRKASVEEARNFKGVIELDEKQFNGGWNGLPDQAEIDFMVFVKGNVIAQRYGVKPDEEILSVYTKKFRERTQRDNTSKPIFTQTEIEPSFAGDWQKFLQQNLKADVAVRNGAPPGTYETFTQFIVDEDGNLSDFKSLTKHGYGMEEEVIRTLKAGPNWKPAMQNGRKVTAYKKQKVTFVVSEG